MKTKKLIEEVQGIVPRVDSDAGSMSVLTLRQRLRSRARTMRDLEKLVRGLVSDGVLVVDPSNKREAFRNWRVSIPAPVASQERKKVSEPTLPFNPTPGAPAPAPAAPSDLDPRWFPEGRGVQVLLRSITPDRAAAILSESERDFKNRTLSNRHVSRLARAIKKGLWEVTGDTIKLDPKGVCYDGQHRLWAVVEADTEVDSYVVFNGVRKQALVIDQSRTRTFADAMKMQGEKNAPVLAATVARVVEHEAGQCGVSATHHAAELAARLAEDADAFRAAVSASVSLSGITGLIRTHGAAIAFIAEHGTPAGVFADFCRDVRHSQVPTNPAAVFRKRCSRVPRDSERIRYALMIKAWNAWLDGREIRSLSWAPYGERAESWPEIKKVGR